MEAWNILDHPLVIASVILLILSFVSLWIHKKLRLWGSLYALSLICALLAQAIEFKTLIPIVSLFLAHYFMSQRIGYFWRFMTVMIAAIISFGFLGHLVAGFHNIPLIHHVQLDASSLPYSLWLNFDKPLVGLFALGFSIPLMHLSKD